MATDEKPQLKDANDILQSLGVAPGQKKAPLKKGGLSSFAKTNPEIEAVRAEEERFDAEPDDVKPSAAEMKRQLTDILGSEQKPRRRRRSPKKEEPEAKTEQTSEPEVLEYSFEEFELADNRGKEETVQAEHERDEYEKTASEAEQKRQRQLEEEEKRQREREEAEQLAEQKRRIQLAEAERLNREEEERQRLLKDKGTRDAFMHRLAGEFESKFKEKYSEPLPEKRKPQPGLKGSIVTGEPEATVPFEDSEKEEGSWFEQIMPKEPSPEKIESEAALFVQKFAEETRLEEEQLSESFKETLTEKFMRERERYMRELNIQPEEENEELTEAEPQLEAVSARRRLDFHIRPEMHQPGAPLQSITYRQDATIREPEPAEEELLQEPKKPTRSAPLPKTAAERIMELAAGLPGEQANQKKTIPKQPTNTDSKPRPVTEPPKKKKRMPLAARGALVSVLVLGLAFAGAYIWQRASGDDNRAEAPSLLTRFFAGENEQHESESEMPELNEPLKIYESRDYSTPQAHTDIMIMRANTRLRNFRVSNFLNIEETQSPGSLILDTVTVDGAIYFKTSEMDKLELRDVRAGRIIVNNTKKPVEILITGNSDIQTIEVKSAVSIRQLDLAEAAPGVQNIVTQAEGGTLDIRLEGISLNTLATEGENSINFVMTSANTVSAQGAVSLHGIGKVVNFALDGDAPLNVLVKGVTVSNMNVKAPGNFNLSTNVDNMSVSKPVSLGGSGEIGSLTIGTAQDEQSSSFTIDVAGLSIQLLSAQTSCKVNSTGSSRINTLIANAPTYVMGNKVSLLQVNNDEVIYESEPDRITTGVGVKPPQSVAQNPNLDYDTPVSHQAPPDTAESDVTTVCGHTRENGGFLMGFGSVDDPYQISDAEQLAHISLHPSSHYVQTANIDIAENSAYAGGFEMLCGNGTAFSGSYDGQGYTIMNIRIASLKENVGLFAENIGTIRNVSIVSGEIASTATTRAYIGGIVGLNYGNGIVEGCMNGARISARNLSYAGGIAGYNFGGKIRDCYNTAKITGGAFSGGIAGVNRQGAITARSYNAGLVEGGELSGAIAGSNDGAVITNCYFLENTSALGIAEGDGAALPRTSEEMATNQFVADLAAGNDNSRWARGTDAYQFPVLVPPNTDSAL